jgi:hypothetical protein
MIHARMKSPSKLYRTTASLVLGGKMIARRGDAAEGPKLRAAKLEAPEYAARRG